MENDLLDSLTHVPLEGKKKKKKVVIPATLGDELGDAPLESSEAAPAPVDAAPLSVDGADDDLAGMELLNKDKKKKKKKNIDSFAQELMSSTATEEEISVAQDDFYSAEASSAPAEEDEEDDGVDYSAMPDQDPLESLQGTDRDYSYRELLAHAFFVIRRANPDHGGERQKYKLAPPEVAREGTKKTVFANFIDTCRRMRRDSDHVMNFLFAELGTSGSVDSDNRLIIKGRFQPKQIETVLRHYISEYITCKICKSRETILTKEHRLLFLHCETCNSTRSVANINSGFSAQIGRRKR